MRIILHKRKPFFRYSMKARERISIFISCVQKCVIPTVPIGTIRPRSTPCYAALHRNNEPILHDFHFCNLLFQFQMFSLQILTVAHTHTHTRSTRKITSFIRWIAKWCNYSMKYGIAKSGKNYSCKFQSRMNTIFVFIYRCNNWIPATIVAFHVPPIHLNITVG